MKIGELFFSLDIGTRTVVGIIGKFNDEGFEIIDFEVESHKNRAMYDGQIHDTESVISAVLKVKGKLEDRLGIKLEKVSIAAAGRSLKTNRVFVEKDIDKSTPINKDLVGSLEIEAIQNAQNELDDNGGAIGEYYFVGHAVVNYYLNGTLISKLLGHRGDSIGVEIIATFLPKVVLDSLFYVIDMSGLAVYNITLEPIAAMDVSIQENFKLLNIALVDIGAGTSDIALMKDGSIFAFAMVPIAGDEITESILQAYLLDFDVAERVKLSMSQDDTISFTDIMGQNHELSSEEIINTTNDVIRNLGKEIAEKILEYNSKAPSAVFLIGGGSQIPYLNTFISEFLGLAQNRVGIRYTDIIKDIKFDNRKMKGPEFITPIGIAVSARIFKEKNFLSITINGEKTKLFNKKKPTVADVLISIGYNPRNLIGRMGNDLNYVLNGVNKTIKGGDSKSATILVNGSVENLYKSIYDGDIIDIDSAKNGEDAVMTIKSLSKTLVAMHIKIDNKLEILKPEIYVNDKKVDKDYSISEGDNIRYSNINKISEIIRILSIPIEMYDIMINGKVASTEDYINKNDIVEFISNEKNIKKSDNDKKSITVSVNGQEINMKGKTSGYIFADIFKYIDLEMDKVKGSLFLRINNMPANYADKINDGDIIKLWWE